MKQEQRIRRLLEEALNSERTPDEVCVGDADILPQVRARWEQLKRVDAQIEQLFPKSTSSTVTRFGNAWPNGEPSPASRQKIVSVGEHEEMRRGRRARRRRLGRAVALEMLRTGIYVSVQDVRRLRREATVAACLRRAHILPVFEVD